MGVLVVRDVTIICHLISMIDDYANGMEGCFSFYFIIGVSLFKVAEVEKGNLKGA